MHIYWKKNQVKVKARKRQTLLKFKVHHTFEYFGCKHVILREIAFSLKHYWRWCHVDDYQERGCFFNDEIKMVNCNADVGCRYEFSNCLLEAYTNKVMLTIEVICILILMERWDLSVTATQFSGRYQQKITFARERSWTASGNFLFRLFIRSYHIPSNISFISYRTWAPILIYQESYQADRGVHWSNILMITIFMILKMITIITAPVMMIMIMVWQQGVGPDD